VIRLDLPAVHDTFFGDAVNVWSLESPRTPIVKADVPDTCIVTRDDQDVGLFCMGGRTGETGQGCYQESMSYLHPGSLR
jgi:hypothetical protein